jgi:hypothetical protein
LTRLGSTHDTAVVTRHSHLLLCAAWCVVPSNVVAQVRCDCAASTCASTASGSATVRGRLSEAEGRDANARVERYLAVTTATPVCSEFEYADAPNSRHAERASTLQIVITDAARREHLRAFVGRVVTLHGSASEQLTAHHHTPLVFEVTAFEPPADDAARALTGVRGTTLYRALVRVRVRPTAAGDVSAADVRCLEQGVGAGYDWSFSGPPPTPTYTCQGGITARGAAARALFRALAAGGIATDAAMGGRSEVAALRVSCTRLHGAVRCELVPGVP